MQQESYQANLKEALKNLTKVNKSIYNSIIDISMQGDLKEWNNKISIGETFQFDFELFKNSEDTNISLLVELIEKVDSTYQAIKNINGLDIGEV
jgi:hypothetical protein